MTRNVLTVACMNKFETNNFECFEMIFFKPNNMSHSFASQNFILKCVSTFELAQTNITKESSLKRVIVLSWLWNILHYNLRKDIILKLYCGFRYTTLCMINRIWVLKQLQMYDFKWMAMLDFICNGSVDLFGMEREQKIQNENICLQGDSN